MAKFRIEDRVIHEKHGEGTIKRFGKSNLDVCVAFDNLVRGHNGSYPAYSYDHFGKNIGMLEYSKSTNHYFVGSYYLSLINNQKKVFEFC